MISVRDDEIVHIYASRMKEAVRNKENKDWEAAATAIIASLVEEFGVPKERVMAVLWPGEKDAT
jgi:hypothetical protein